MGSDSIDSYNAALSPGDRRIGDALRAGIARALPEAEGRIWHAHPVWFLAGNPVVGYSRLKSCIRLMFWSGQSFASPGLEAEGSFKAATARFTEAGQIEPELLHRWLADSRDVQWDYRNIVKRKGRLDRLK